MQDHEAEDINEESGSIRKEISYTFSEAKDMFCGKYCADENEIHIHDTKTFNMYRGIDISNTKMFVDVLFVMTHLHSLTNTWNTMMKIMLIIMILYVVHLTDAFSKVTLQKVL